MNFDAIFDAIGTLAGVDDDFVTVQDVREMLKNHPDIDTNQTLMVNFNKFAASSLEFFVYTFTKTTNWVEFHHIKENVMLEIIRIVESHGAEFAFPTQTLHLAEPEPPINGSD